MLSIFLDPQLGVSENRLNLNPMVLLIIIPMKNGYFIGKINPTFSDTPSCFRLSRNFLNMCSFHKSGQVWPSESASDHQDLGTPIHLHVTRNPSAFIVPAPFRRGLNAAEFFECENDHGMSQGVAWQPRKNWCFRLDLSLWPTKEFKLDMDVEELHGYAYVDVHLSICV